MTLARKNAEILRDGIEAVERRATERRKESMSEPEAMKAAIETEEVELMRIAMRDNWNDRCSGSCKQEGGWMERCPCLEVAKTCYAALRSREGEDKR